jgi:hypothetical protein
MLQEAADELCGGNGHHLGVVGVAVVFPLEGDLALLQLQQAAIGNGHAMSVAAQILQHVLRSAEGSLGVNHPVFLFPWGQIAGKSQRVAERFQVAEEVSWPAA